MILRPKIVWWAMAERERRKYRGRFYRWAAAFHRHTDIPDTP
jgi:hypothetical protein